MNMADLLIRANLMLMHVLLSYGDMEKTETRNRNASKELYRRPHI
jgi:hypothetical protein